jgi:hypothetical protein
LSASCQVQVEGNVLHDFGQRTAGVHSGFLSENLKLFRPFE